MKNKWKHKGCNSPGLKTLKVNYELRPRRSGTYFLVYLIPTSPQGEKMWTVVLSQLPYTSFSEGFPVLSYFCANTSSSGLDLMVQHLVTPHGEGVSEKAQGPGCGLRLTCNFALRLTCSTSSLPQCPWFSFDWNIIANKQWSKHFIDHMWPMFSDRLETYCVIYPFIHPAVPWASTGPRGRVSSLPQVSSTSVDHLIVRGVRAQHKICSWCIEAWIQHLWGRPG